MAFFKKNISKEIIDDFRKPGDPEIHCEDSYKLVKLVTGDTLNSLNYNKQINYYRDILKNKKPSWNQLALRMIGSYLSYGLTEKDIKNKKEHTEHLKKVIIEGLKNNKFIGEKYIKVNKDSRENYENTIRNQGISKTYEEYISVCIYRYAKCRLQKTRKMWFNDTQRTGIGRFYGRLTSSVSTVLR